MTYPYHDTMRFNRGMGALQAQIDALEAGGEAYDDTEVWDALDGLETAMTNVESADTALDGRLDVVEPLVTAAGSAITTLQGRATALEAKSPTTAMKTGSTDYTTTTPADDPDLVLALGTGTFDIDVNLLLDGTTANDAKIGLTFSGTATVGGTLIANRSAAASTSNSGWFYDAGTHFLGVFTNFTSQIASTGCSGQGVPTPVRLKARVTVTVAGNIKVQAAKAANTDTGGGANATRTLAFSSITAIKVA